MIITLDVKQDHIDDGSPGEGDCCAIALAIKEQFPFADGVDVNTPQIQFSCEGKHYCASTPNEVADFMAEYDDEDRDGKEYIAPATFTLDFEITSADGCAL